MNAALHDTSMMYAPHYTHHGVHKRYDDDTAALPHPLRTRPCRHYLNGRCTWGTLCRFAHGPPFYQTPDGMPLVRIGGGAQAASQDATPQPRTPPPPITAPANVAHNPAVPVSPALAPKSPSRYAHNPYSTVSPMHRPSTPSDLSSPGPSQRSTGEWSNSGLGGFSLTGSRSSGGY